MSMHGRNHYDEGTDVLHSPSDTFGHAGSLRSWSSPASASW